MAKLWDQLNRFRDHLETLLQEQGYSERNVQSPEMAEYISFAKSWMAGSA